MKKHAPLFVVLSLIILLAAQKTYAAPPAGWPGMGYVFKASIVASLGFMSAPLAAMAAVAAVGGLGTLLVLVNKK